MLDRKSVYFAYASLHCQLSIGSPNRYLLICCHGNNRDRLSIWMFQWPDCFCRSNPIHYRHHDIHQNCVKITFRFLWNILTACSPSSATVRFAPSSDNSVWFRYPRLLSGSISQKFCQLITNLIQTVKGKILTHPFQCVRTASLWRRPKTASQFPPIAL